MFSRLRRWLASKLDPAQYAEPREVIRYVDQHVHRLTRPVLDDYKRKVNVNLFVSAQTTDLQVSWMAGVNYAISILERDYSQVG